jgi:F-type H+-transporting ATPase subunit a
MLNIAWTAFSEGGGHGEGAGTDFIMGHVLDHVVFHLEFGGFDLSITKHVIMLWIASGLLLTFLIAFFRKPSLIPRGFANALEAIVVFVDEDILKPYLGKHSREYAPYLLTAFFFILVCNFMGLVPFGATATGDIAVTATLAVLTFIIGIGAGIKHKGLLGYLKHFLPPGMPWPLGLLMAPFEVIGMLAKHFTLAMRLFANMVAGHIVIFTFLSIIFLFKNFIVGGVTLAGILFVSLLEVLIALLQAYIFTTLSAVYISMSISHDH